MSSGQACLRSAIVVCALLLPPPTNAGTVEVSLSGADPADRTSCETSAVIASRMGAEDVLVVEATEVPSVVSFSLPDGSWQLHFESARCWAPEKSIEVAGSRTVELKIWPTVQVIGKFAFPVEVPAGEPIRLRFTPRSERGTEGLRGQVECSLIGRGAFSCSVPVGGHDLKVSLKGYAAHYAWGVSVEAGGRESLGVISLKPGASFVGWVITEDGENLPEETRVSVVPAGISEATTIAEEVQQAAMTRQTEIGPSGFFQVSDLREGQYIATATAPGYGETSIGIRTVEGRESSLRDTLVLAAPLKLSMVVDPPTLPSGEEWRIFVGRTDKYRSHLRPVLEEGFVPLSGWFEMEGLSRGSYVLRILGEGEDSVASKEFVLGDEPLPIQIRLTSVHVAGEVTLGKDPLEGTIWFGGRYGSEKIEARSNAEGKYTAVLPRPGKWPIRVESDDPRVDRKLPGVHVPAQDGARPSTVDIELPDTRVFGSLLEPSGEPPDFALVYAIATGTSKEGTVWQQARDGDYEFRGLGEGTVWVFAESATARSAAAVLHLAEEMDQELNLVLEPKLNVEGIVVGESGPVPGAIVVLSPSQEPHFLAGDTPCDAAGKFSVELPAGTTEVVATVAALGHTISTSKHGIVEGEPLRISLPSQGGNLVVRVSNAVWDKSTPWVLAVSRNGVPLSRFKLYSWARMLHPDLQTLEEGEGFVAPHVAPGVYQACKVPISEFAMWWVGQQGQWDCMSGHLSQHGHLELSLDDDL